MNNYKISIVVPIYNIENFVEDCIKSLIHQTYKNIEILLVNDGSKDDSLNICECYRLHDERIVIINKENGGLSSARNAGLKMATGDYCLFLDGDDQLNKYAIEILVGICDEFEGKLDFIQFKYKEIYNIEYINTHRVNRKPQYVVKENKQDMFNYLYLIGGEAVSACTKLYKKELFNDLSF